MSGFRKLGHICMHVYAYLRGHKYVTSSMILTLYDWLNNCATAFQLQFMTLTVDAIDGVSPSYKMRYRLQPKKTKVILY